ncbi:MAG TPA: protein phosphatase 2C domain-containing protein [Pyrinomonadaceae bacterium]|jgi:PPM family protein phosphatase|nr:protein phosphatase 2C domain-containing protein [Pyrinomonadaceae bacterium]
MNYNSEVDDTEATATPLDETPPSPFSSRVNVDFFGMTDKGYVRTKNEDHFLIVRCGRAVETVLTSLTEEETMSGELYEETGYGMIVADGVGGVVGGEVASRQAIYTLLSLALHTPDWQFRWGAKERNAVMFRMRDRFRRVNAALLRDAAVHVSRGGMWTTMTAALTHGTDLVIGHIGDSRAYLLHDGKLIKLTHDHREGANTPTDPLMRELSGVLVEALGSPEGECDPQVDDYLLVNDDQLLLCTDGLTDMVDDAEIELVLNSAVNAKSACRSLIDLSLNNGGRDNVTVIVARYSIPPVT